MLARHDVLALDYRNRQPCLSPAVATASSPVTPGPGLPRAEQPLRNAGKVKSPAPIRVIELVGVHGRGPSVEGGSIPQPILAPRRGPGRGPSVEAGPVPQPKLALLHPPTYG